MEKAPNHAHTGNLVLPQWLLHSHHSPGLPRATELTGASRLGWREVVPYCGEELKKNLPKGYGITDVKHRGLLEAHCVCHKGHSHFLQAVIFFSRLTQNFDPPPPALVCCECCQGRSPGAVTLPSSFACRAHITHFRAVEPRLSHPEPGRSWLAVDKKYRNLLFICSLILSYQLCHFSTLHGDLCLDLCFRLPFPPMQEASAAA